MRVAIPTFGPRISPRFDCAASLLIMDIEKGGIVNRREESMEGMAGVEEVRVLLAAQDQNLLPDLVGFAREIYPDVRIDAGKEPAPIAGGLWLISGDGRRQVNADWDTRVQELLPILAERLGPLL